VNGFLRQIFSPSHTLMEDPGWPPAEMTSMSS
jgi:hypothetical protein